MRSASDSIRFRPETRSWSPSCPPHNPNSSVSQVPLLLSAAYPSARETASAETRLPLATFPEACPWTVEQALRDDFWPAA